MRAGESFADPDYELSAEWIETHARVLAAQREHQRRSGPARVLLVNGSSRNDETCPGEMSKTHRLLTLAREVLDGTRGIVTEVLDLSRLTAEYGRVIYPCKACVSTAMPLCHWPCSCYPNHAIGQVRDWMNEIYPKWVAAHGILIVTPVHWYQAPSVLKLMIDRLVCADGGNPDPTTTSGKDPDRYVGYFEPYATSHEALDRDRAIQQEVRNVATAFAAAVRARRARRSRPREAHQLRPK